VATGLSCGGHSNKCPKNITADAYNVSTNSVYIYNSLFEILGARCVFEVITVEILGR
jgi:hypothetical protein